MSSGQRVSFDDTTSVRLYGAQSGVLDTTRPTASQSALTLSTVSSPSTSPIFHSPQASPSSIRRSVEFDTSPDLSSLPGAFPLHRNPPSVNTIKRSSSGSDKMYDIISAKKPPLPTRVIKTFEEVEVQKTVLAEEWYEELECGICSHVLGVPHALVPCGHSFCGTCAWQWIKTNKNVTCPHCRVTVNDQTPFVPNISVDQIIDRKLRSLPEGEQKQELLEERKEKLDAWKTLQASIAPVKPRKTRGFGVDEILGFFETPAEQAEVRARRASRHFAELGAPLGHNNGGNRRSEPRHILGPYGTMTLGDIRRLEVEGEAIATRMEVRRLREALMREREREAGINTSTLGALTEEPLEISPSPPPIPLPPMRSNSPWREGSRDFNFFNRGSNGSRQHSGTIDGGETRSRTNSGGQSRHSGGNGGSQFPNRQAMNQRSSSSPQNQPQPQAQSPAPQERNASPSTTHPQRFGRPTPFRSSALAARQARGRGASNGETREHPLVVLSDSDGEA